MSRTLEERFWAKVDVRGPDECWEWMASRSHAGYGRFHVGSGHGRSVIASRVSYEINIGPIPEGMWVLHHCDNPPCCNPGHLYVGTPSDNMRDMVERGRCNPDWDQSSWKIGRKVKPQSITKRIETSRMRGTNSRGLTEDNVREIRRLYATGEWSQRELAMKFGVYQTNIGQIVRRVTWKHVA